MREILKHRPLAGFGQHGRFHPNKESRNRNYLSIDVEVWMNDPDDMDFKPRTHLNGNRFSISSATTGKEMVSVELDDEQMEAAERDRQVELRVKFGVHGMHGRLNHIHPIIADGKAKKLAFFKLETVQPILFN